MRVWLVVALACVMLGEPAVSQEAAPTRRAFTVVAADGRFSPNVLEVVRDDLVQVTLRSVGAPHSFAIDAYRVSKRAGADETITFEWRADRTGRFTFYCNLSSQPQCRDMTGTLVVRER